MLWLNVLRSTREYFHKTQYTGVLLYTSTNKADECPYIGSYHIITLMYRRVGDTKISLQTLLDSKDKKCNTFFLYPATAL